MGGGEHNVYLPHHIDQTSTLTTILNLYKSEVESAKQPYSAFAGLYLGT